MELVLIIAAPLVVCLLVFSIYGGYIFWRAVSREKIIQYRAKYRFQPDQLGNYEVYFDPQTDIYVRPRPGNKAFPDAPANVYQNPQIAKKEPTRPLIINTPRPLQIEQSERSLEPNVLPETNVHALLADAKANRRPKADSIRQITGVTKGSSTAWRGWSQIWDELPAPGSGSALLD